MRCPKCGKDVELQNKQVGVDENGKPIFNEYAICRDCKKQWNLDKQKVKKAPADDASDHTQPKRTTAKPVKAEAPKKAPMAEPKAAPKKKTAAPAATAAASTAATLSDTAPIPPIKKTTADRPVRKAAAPGTSSPKEAAPGKEPVRTRKAAPSRETDSNTETARTRSTNPNKDAVRTKAAAPAKKPASANDAVPVKKAAPAGDAAERRKPAPKRNPSSAQATAAKIQDEQKYGNIPSEKVRTKREHAVRQNYEEMLATDPEKKPAAKKRTSPPQANQPARMSNTSSKAAVSRRPEPEPEVDEMDYEPVPKFKALRIIFGIISLVAFGFFAYKGFMAGLSNISSGKNATTGTIYIVLALCMLVAGLLLLIMQKKATVFAFVLPMLCYLGSAVFAFFKRGDDKWLLYGAIASAVLGVIFLILTFASGRAEEYDDFDDPFDDDAFDEDFDD